MRSSLFEKIWDHQFKDSKICFLQDQVLSCESKRNTIDSEGVLLLYILFCVLRIDDLI